MDPIVEEAVRQVLARTDADAILLFGSRADGRAREDSDVDLFALCPIGGMEVYDAEALGRRVRCYAYNSAILESDCSLPRLHVAMEGVPVYDPKGYGALFLEKLHRALRKLPKTSPEAKAQMKKWISDLEAAAFAGTPESDFIRARLLVRSLEILFLLNDQRYPSKSLAYAILKRDAPEAFRLFRSALAQNATEEDVRRWVEAALYHPWPVNALDYQFERGAQDGRFA